MSERDGTTNLKLNDEFVRPFVRPLDRVQNRLKIQIQGRSMSDPPLSDIDFKNKNAWL